MVVVTTRVVAVHTFDEKMYQAGHLVYRWMSGIKEELRLASIKQAPHSTTTGGRVNKNPKWGPPGRLKAGIGAAMAQTGLREITTVLTSEAPYTLWVHGGTGDYYARMKSGNTGRFGFAEKGAMWLPPNPGWGGARWVQKRRGQAANPFFFEALRIVGAKHSSIRMTGRGAATFTGGRIA